jgi:hypothetical protein
MQLCRKCGQEIIFRHKNGILTPIHIAGACNGRPPYSPDSLRKAVYNRCKRCDQMAYFLQHNGGTVWLDALGPPWPKHKCSDWNVQEEKDLARKAQEAKMLASSIRALTGSKGEGDSNVPVITNAQGNGSVASGSRARPGVQSAMAQRDLNGGQAEYRKCEICSAMVRVSRFLGHMAKATACLPVRRMVPRAARC